MKKLIFAILVLCLCRGFWGDEKAQDKLLIKDGAHLAVVGDSITEQKIYSSYIELYLAVCTPQIKAKVFQFGWGGEQVTGFKSRMKNDLLLFQPDVVTLCYGMNDAKYSKYSEAQGNTFRKNLDSVVKYYKEAKVLVIVGSPGAVDTKYYKRGPEIYNETLKIFAEIAKQVAADNGVPFADIHGPMMDAMQKAKKELGEEYDVCGKDGVHPEANGHVIMAQAFLKALGFDGDIGTITIDMKGSASATAGHNIISSVAGKTVIESSRYPFCFYGNDKSPSSNRSILPYISFNDDLNRYILIVKNLEKPEAKVEWGDVSKEFTREQLEKGINLAKEFPDNPFSKPFQNVQLAIVKKESYETQIIKDYITKIPKMLTNPKQADKKDEIMANRAALWQKWEKLQNNIPELVVPVTHTINIVQ